MNAEQIKMIGTVLTTLITLGISIWANNASTNQEEDMNAEQIKKAGDMLIQLINFVVDCIASNKKQRKGDKNDLQTACTNADRYYHQTDSNNLWEVGGKMINPWTIAIARQVVISLASGIIVSAIRKSADKMLKI